MSGWETAAGIGIVSSRAFRKPSVWCSFLLAGTLFFEEHPRFENLSAGLVSSANDGICPRHNSEIALKISLRVWCLTQTTVYIPLPQFRSSFEKESAGLASSATDGIYAPATIQVILLGIVGCERWFCVGGFDGLLYTPRLVGMTCI